MEHCLCTSLGACSCVAVWQISNITDLVPKLNTTLNPVLDQVNSAITNVDSVNNTIQTTNISSYLAQVDSSKVGRMHARFAFPNVGDPRKADDCG